MPLQDACRQASKGLSVNLLGMLHAWLGPLVNCCRNPHNVVDRGGLNEWNSKVPGAEKFHDAPGFSSTVELLMERRVPFAGTLPAGPQDRGPPTFATSGEISLQGAPLHSGRVLQLILGETIQEIVLAIYIDGFSLAPTDHLRKLDHAHSLATHKAWSPFSLIEKCQVKAMQDSAYWAVFKLTVFRVEQTDLFYYFATTGTDAHALRDTWVERIAHSIRSVTMSLYPPHAITVEPVPGVPQTCTRIMAGYLLQGGVMETILLCYCELHAYSAGEAQLTIYRDEWCERALFEIAVTDDSVVSTRRGSFCTVFGVDQYRFCARTEEEKDLWLRAISNIKVKLMFDAPDPTEHDLSIFRAAISERLATLDYNIESLDPLLQLVPRMPIPTPRGDTEPIDEAVDPAMCKQPAVRDSMSRRTSCDIPGEASVSQLLHPKVGSSILVTSSASCVSSNIVNPVDHADKQTGDCVASVDHADWPKPKKRQHSNAGWNSHEPLPSLPPSECDDPQELCQPVCMPHTVVRTRQIQKTL